MKAAVVHDFTSPLSIEEVEKPTPGTDQIVVKIETSGLCHTDIHAAHGDWPVKPNLPFIPVHERSVCRICSGVWALRCESSAQYQPDRGRSSGLCRGDHL